MSRVNDARTHHRAFHSATGDHVTLLNVFHQYMAVAEHKRSAWCRKRFLNGKALRAAGDIEQQLLVRIAFNCKLDTSCIQTCLLLPPDDAQVLCCDAHCKAVTALHVCYHWHIHKMALDRAGASAIACTSTN